MKRSNRRFMQLRRWREETVLLLERWKEILPKYPVPGVIEAKIKELEFQLKEFDYLLEE